MEKIAEQHRAIANLASYLNKERTDNMYFLDGGLTLNIPTNQHDRLLQDENYHHLVDYYQGCGGQVVIIEPTGIEFEDLAQCFS